MTVIPFPQRQPPGIKRKPRVSPASLTNMSRHLDNIARACEAIKELRGCTGAPALEATALSIAETTGELAEALSLSCIAAADADLIERERA